MLQNLQIHKSTKLLSMFFLKLCSKEKSQKSLQCMSRLFIIIRPIMKRSWEFQEKPYYPGIIFPWNKKMWSI